MRTSCPMHGIQGRTQIGPLPPDAFRISISMNKQVWT